MNKISITSSENIQGYINKQILIIMQKKEELFTIEKCLLIISEQVLSITTGGKGLMTIITMFPPK